MAMAKELEVNNPNASELHRDDNDQSKCQCESCLHYEAINNSLNGEGK